MENLFVKDLAKLTGVSVQTLHYYDRISLLKPSIRLSNGYRVYSRNDLLRLQQIVALKFFGFELSQIAKLLISKDESIEHFTVQAEILKKKASHLLEASKTLNNIVAEIKDHKSVSFETIIKLIEVYHMTQELEHSWVKNIFTPEELKEYATFEAEWKAKSTPKDQEHFEKSWQKLVADIESNLKQDPASEIGIKLGGTCMDLINGVYGKKYAHLRTKKWERGFGEGMGLDEVGLTQETVQWLDKAIDAYWHNRAHKILAQIGKEDDSVIATHWDRMLDDIYGNDSSRKKELMQKLKHDQKINDIAAKWLKDHY